VSLKKYADRFDKLQLRERRLILIAAVVGVLLIGYSLLIEPAQQGNQAKRVQLATQQNELNTLQEQLISLREQAKNPDAALHQNIADMKRNTAAIESELHQFDNLLVTPQQMPQMLQSMLARHRGLEVVRLKTLAAAPLLQPVAATNAPAPQSNQAQPAPSSAKPLPPPGGIYRHAIEITIAGSYAELTAYADELQRISPRPLWSAMQLKVVEYPRSELTFTLYTLSLDLPWLAV
jgi:MSHA biogenesis protein MshJ